MEMRSPLLPRECKEYRLAEKPRRLKSLRGLTQREVAQTMGIDESTVRNYELVRRMPKPEHVRGLAAALEVMPEALIPFDDAAGRNELFLMTVELADAYGFEFGYSDDFTYIAPTRGFFIQGIGRWAKACEAMHKNEETLRDDYELWKDEFHDRFSKRDYLAVYPDYDPMKPDSGQQWISDRFSAAPKDMCRIRGLNQEELAEKAGSSLFTLRGYEQGKRMPCTKQLEALCEALDITSTALTKHYFGSPKAMCYLFAIAGAANLTPERNEKTGSRLRTQGNMIEWAFVRFTDKLEEPKDGPATEKRDELTHWLAMFDLITITCETPMPRASSTAATRSSRRKRKYTAAMAEKVRIKPSN